MTAFFFPGGIHVPGSNKCCTGMVSCQSKFTIDPSDHPSLPDHVVYNDLKTGKKTCSVPGDIPVKVIEEFLPELTTPIAAIYREAIATHT